MRIICGGNLQRNDVLDESEIEIMDRKRLYQTLMINVLGGGRQTDWLKKHRVFHRMGENCDFNMHLIPLYPRLISFGNNVNVASGVKFHTHDGVNNLLNKMTTYVPKRVESRRGTFQEGIGCIEIGDNISIGSGAIISYGVHIGNNVIVSAGSIVIKDIPDNCVVRGVPAEVVCSFDAYVRIRASKKYFPPEIRHQMGRTISKELEEYLWSDFKQKHLKQG